ncbi:Ku protein, partial [Streptomyces sp. NPDC001939]
HRVTDPDATGGTIRVLVVEDDPVAADAHVLYPGVEVDQLRDEYRHAVDQLVEAKASGGRLAGPPEPGPAVDLMAALEESVRAARIRATE